MSEIYNKEALDALDEHSEAEEMARVASPKVRLVLGAMVAMIVVVAYWCIFGTVNYKVTAQGIVFPFGQAVPVSAPYNGTVARCVVKPSSSVVRGTHLLVLQADSVVLTDSVLADIIMADVMPTDTTFREETAVAGSHEVSPIDSAGHKGPVSPICPYDSVAALCDGVVISTLPVGAEFKAGEPVAWLLPQARHMAGRELLCYVPYTDLRKLRVGQQVQVTPTNMEREDWGYAFGSVVGIEQYPMTQQEIVDRLKLDALAAFITGGQAMCEVRVALDMKDGTLVWSRAKSRSVKVGNGALCHIQVITEKKPVWRVLVGAVDNAVETITGN